MVPAVGTIYVVSLRSTEWTRLPLGRIEFAERTPGDIVRAENDIIDSGGWRRRRAGEMRS